MNELSKIARDHIPTIPVALKALAAMERDLLRAGTYAEIRKVIDAGAALSLLFNDVDIVKAQAEDVILAAGARIGEEIDKVPKAGNRFTARGKSGRKAALPSGTTRARYQKLAQAKQQLKTIAMKLRAEGKDATVSAVVRAITQGNKAQRRCTRERDLAAKIVALPQRRYGVILADPPWRFEPFSRETGMDRAAENHYPTMSFDELTALPLPAAEDCALFLWATAPMLREALALMAEWGFEYRSHCIWDKVKPGTGYWFRNQHELLLVGVRGDIPAPAPGQQYASVIASSRTRHSAKPGDFAEIIEEMFPTLPRLEMFAREQRAGWDAWGNEAPARATEEVA